MPLGIDLLNNDKKSLKENQIIEVYFFIAM
jgi:hypothetical protein